MDNVTTRGTPMPVNTNKTNIFMFNPVLDQSQIYGFGITFTAIAVASIIFNLLMMIAILHNRYGNMWTVTNYYIFNMAFVDLLTGLIVIPCRMVQFVYLYWFLGQFLCVIHIAFEKVLFCCGIYTLTLVAFARYRAIVHPFSSNYQFKGALWRLGVIWLLSFATCIPLMIHMPFGVYALKRVLLGSTDCQPKYSSLEDGARFEQIFYALFMTFAFILPFIIISYCYYQIYVILHNRKYNSNLISTMNTYSNLIDRTNRKVIYMLLTITILFFICWFPHNLTVILFNIAPLFDVWINSKQDFQTFINISQIGKILCYLNSCQNFIVCLIFNEPFRDAIVDILTLGHYERKELSSVRDQAIGMSSPHRSQDHLGLTKIESLRD